jgi:hypothetical protein
MVAENRLRNSSERDDLIMANIQKYFEQFHDRIRTDYEMNSTLREKRDILLERIRKYLKDQGLPLFEKMDQGSYAMKTGVIPVGREYDIDVGLYFPFSETEHSAADVRSWIRKAVAGHTSEIEDKGPCCRVIYSDGYHVDLVMYASWEENGGPVQNRLAHKKRGWRPADPARLLEYVESVRSRYESTEDTITKVDQFRRVVRCLRRWDDVRISKESSAKPSGLGYVLLTDKNTSPQKTLDGKPDDRMCLEQFALNTSGVMGRLTAFKPTPEHEDVLAKVSDDDQVELKEKLKALFGVLSAAGMEPDPVKACTTLQVQFGADFPVPEPEDTAKKSKSPAIVTSSSSA